jgi:hypothetical protein
LTLLDHRAGHSAQDIEQSTLSIARQCRDRGIDHEPCPFEPATEIVAAQSER